MFDTNPHSDLEQYPACQLGDVKGEVMKHWPTEGENSLPRKVYVLTCWQERDALAGTVTWRFRLEMSDAKSRQLFTSLDMVLTKIETDLQHITSVDG